MAEINWTDIGERLYNLCAAEIRRFTTEHADETFYGFALDCNSDYGDVLLCLNTAEDLHQRAVLYSTDPPNRKAFEEIDRSMAESMGQTYQPKPLKPVEENERRLRWALGDWKYQGFNSEAFDEGWSPFQEAIADAAMEEDDETSESPTQSQFMQTACRVLVRLERDDVFHDLRKTDDFQSWVADHDELDEDSWKRLNAVRQAMADG